MSQPKILLIGKNGQVATESFPLLTHLGDVVCLGSRECDLNDQSLLRAKIKEVSPDIIVNAAAYTAVDKAETDEANATAVNATAVGVMGEEAAKLNCLVVHYSTDYVFSGDSSSPYLEDDKTAPNGVYGKPSSWEKLCLKNQKRSI